MLNFKTIHLKIRNQKWENPQKKSVKHGPTDNTLFARRENLDHI